MALSGWRRAVADQVSATSKDAQSNRSGSPRSKIRDVRLGFPIRLHQLVLLAAQKRGMSIASYGRRAVLAWVAHDLGMSAVDLIREDRGASRYGEVRSGLSKDEELELFGDWEI